MAIIVPLSLVYWYSMRREYRALLRRKREQLWQTKVETEKSTPRQLWRSLDAVLGRGCIQPSEDINAEQFHRFFDDKVAGVRSTTADAPPPSFTLTSLEASLSSSR